MQALGIHRNKAYRILGFCLPETDFRRAHGPVLRAVGLLRGWWQGLERVVGELLETHRCIWLFGD